MAPAADRQCCEADLLPAGTEEVGRTLATAGFAALWRGEPTRPSDLVPDAPGQARAVAAALARQGRAEVDDDGRLVGIHGLTLQASRHRIDHGGLAHQTWCAFDAVGIPAALRLTATVDTVCPACGTSLRVTFDHGAATAQGNTVLWVPGSAGRNLLADFCAKADLYCTQEHLEQHLAPSGTDGDVIDVAAAADLGRSAWADVQHVDIGGRR
jgi:alkylmercury lyase